MEIETVEGCLCCCPKPVLLRVVLIVVCVPVADLPQVAEHPTNVRGKGIVHGAGAGTDDHVEERVDVGAEVLPPEIRAAYDLWSLYTLSVEFPRLHSKEVERVFHENDNRLTPSYKALRSIYAAALAAEHAGMEFDDMRSPGKCTLKRSCIFVQQGAHCFATAYLSPSAWLTRTLWTRALNLPRSQLRTPEWHVQTLLCDRFQPVR